MRRYDALGYVPADEVEHAAARTLDFAYNDWGVLQVGQFLGEDSPAVCGGAGELASLARRTQHYRNTFDPTLRLARGRHADGSWGPHSEYEWGGAHIEGGVWQCTWGVPHDPAGLAEVMGGPAALVDRLDRMLATPPRFELGSYGCVIHEMAEMAALNLGQYKYAIAGSNPRPHGSIRRCLLPAELLARSPMWQPWQPAAAPLPLSLHGLRRCAPPLPKVGAPRVRHSLHGGGRWPARRRGQRRE